MLYLIHGENTAAVQNKLKQLIGNHTKSQHAKVTRVDADKLSSVDLRQILGDTNLFGEKTILVIAKAGKIDYKILGELAKKDKIVICYDNIAIRSKKILNLFPSANIFYFQTPQFIFKLLESIGNSNKSNTLILLDSVLKKEPEALVLFWLKRHFRELFLLQNNSKLLKIPDWKKGKLSSQIKIFPENKLTQTYMEIIGMEYKLKTGKLEEGLKIALVNLILSV
jgi:hypothetical protein